MWGDFEGWRELVDLRRAAGGFPGFGVFPTDVGGVVEVEEEAGAAIEEAEAEDVVLDEGKRRVDEGHGQELGEAEAGAALAEDEGYAG